MKDSQSAGLRLKKKPKKFKNSDKKKGDGLNELFFRREDKKEKTGGIIKPVVYVTSIVVPLILLSAFIALNRLNAQAIDQIKKVELLSLDYRIELSPYPQFDKFSEPQISAQAAIIIDPDLQVVMYSKNADVRFSAASTTKMMTALVGLDYYKENSLLTIFTPSIEGSYIGVHAGEKYAFKDLLYAMFLPSSNEAAYAVAQNYPGGIDEFTRKMNEKAQEMKLVNTHFSDPAGLDDDSNFSTPSDLAKLAGYVIKNRVLAEIVSTKEKIIADASGRNKIDLKNLNKLLGQEGVNGVKTGTTEGAGEVLITSKSENGHTFILVVMKSKDRFSDTKRLLSLVNNNVRYMAPELPNTFSSAPNPLSYGKNE